MNPTWLAFLGLTIIVGVLVAVLAFALLRFASAARDVTRSPDNRVESALLSSALEEAIAKLKAQERATAARAAASEQLSREIVASLTSGLIVVDHVHRVQIANPAAQRILGLTNVPADADYRTVLSDVSALADVIAESLGSNSPVMRRTVAMDTPRGIMHLGVSVSPLAADAGPSGAICLFTDLTGVVALEEQLRLKEALARLGELTAGLAHEFRNGLATIHGYGRLLDPAALPEPYRPYVEGIRGEAQALGEVVANFLKFARPEPLTLVPVDLRTLVERAAEDAPQARITLHGDFGVVEADDVLLRQAMSNLFRNSVEACAVAKTVPEITVEATRDEAVVHLEVRDNGPGIRPDALAQVFQPFFTTRPGGTGLGLAIVQKVVVSHNGLISAGNRPEGGAVFRLSLPLRVRDSSAEA